MFTETKAGLRDERGIAMVAALGFAAVLFVVALALVHQLLQHTKNVAAARQKSYAFYAAEAGVEAIRDYLWANGCRPPNWCGRLDDPTTDADGDGDNNDPGYRSFDPTDFTWGASLPGTGANSVTVSTFIKDNEDASDYSEDSDQIVFVLATAVDAGLLSGSDDDSYASIEAMIMFTGGSEMKQKGLGQTKQGRSRETGGAMNRRQG